MDTKLSFNVNVNDVHYTIKSSKNNGVMFYEVFTNCEKLFTLAKNNYGNWETKEDDVIPITESLLEDIGTALEEAETAR